MRRCLKVSGVVPSLCRVYGDGLEWILEWNGRGRSGTRGRGNDEERAC